MYSGKLPALKFELFREVRFYLFYSILIFSVYFRVGRIPGNYLHSNLNYFRWTDHGVRAAPVFVEPQRGRLWNGDVPEKKYSYIIKPGGLDLSRRGLDRDSRSWHWQRVSLDSQENLVNFKKLVLTIEKSRLRSRNLDFVSTTPSSLKSLNLDTKDSLDLNLNWSRL